MDDDTAGVGPVERPVGRPEPERREDGMPTSADERYLRRLLARHSRIPHIYSDDGEAQGQQRGVTIDFMREPVADIDAKLMALSLARHEPPNDGATALAVNAELAMLREWVEDLKRERVVLQKISARRAGALERVGLHADCTMEEAQAVGERLAGLGA